MPKRIQSRTIIALSLFLITPMSIFTRAQIAPAKTSTPLDIQITNNQPFPVRMPIAVKSGNLTDDIFKTSDGKAVQKDGDDLIFVVDLPASSAQNFRLQNGASGKTTNKLFVLNPTENGVSLNFAGAELGRLSWQILYRDSKPEELKGVPYSTKADFSKRFQPLPIKFEKISEGAVFDVWRGAAEDKGLQLSIELRVFHDGFLDMNSDFKNVGAEKTEDVYAAVVTRWQQPKTAERAVCYDYRIRNLSANDYTNFRVGESRNWYVQRGVDWFRTNTANGAAVAVMHDFSQSFTVHQDAKGKRPARFVGANIPQIGYELQTAGDDIFQLTEIARSNLRSYAERLEDNRLMPPGESVAFSSRFVFSKNAMT
ncbi:MAG TPA: hypothetical protein VGP58_11810, partial [Pyrinomonadaceae bacterium]|nr:hypothetical protein [Pyrinomonadaceae bacterium]